MKRLIAIVCLLSHVEGGVSPSVSCDRVESGTCYVDGEQSISGDAIVAPSLLEGVPSGTAGDIGTLRIASGAKLRCYGALCKITIRDFAEVFVTGTLEGSDIRIEASERVKIPAGGAIYGSGMGHPKAEGPAAGIASCGYKDSKYRGASHGGRGGSDCKNAESRVSHGTYGSESAPSDFGSGGACGSAPAGGGGKVHIAAAAIVVDGIVEENGDDRPSGPLGSGGSVLLIADQVVGSSSIEARGGSCGSATYACAAGGGGRIALHGDSISEDTLAIDVDGGDMKQCDQAKGRPGTLYTQCRTSTCYNGGTALSGDECGCKCAEPWGGGDCTVCERSCLNGGEIDPSTCTCSCPFGWTGATCTTCNGADLCSEHGTCNSQKECSCDANYFGDDCSVFCETSETCSTNGYCSPSGSCLCMPGKVGTTCACDEKDCTSSVARSALCSDKGTCSDKECMCEPGYYGCNCEVFCAQSTTCSGHGTCSVEGSCMCDSGYIGDDCGELDIENYCRVGENNEVFTISGRPCLLGLDDTIGHGFDIIQGAKTSRVLQLRYTKGRTFKHNLIGTFEIPDNVDCEEITVDNLVSSTRTFRGTLEYRKELASEFGVTGGFKSGFFSASAEFGTVREFRFQQQQFLSEKKQYHRLYSCKVRTSEPIFTARATEFRSGQTGEQRVRSLGTHVIDRAVFGGFIKVRAYMSSCLLATLDMSELSTEVGYAFAGVAVSGKYSSNCDLVNTHASFEKEVGGGDKSKLIVADMTDPNFLGAWIDSLHISPTVTRRFVYDMGVLVPEVQSDIDQYELFNEVTDEITIEEDPEVCPEVEKGKSSCAEAATSLGESAGESAMSASFLHIFIGVASAVFYLSFW
uniref:EGF-like domain-containing protein n=1 Tax=Odontella aurita TaxID=265563 RepID=A0A7S4MUC2_9STRA|mmetsp:Transcript_33025/g.98264  ORF Transcript_33025/g.98264 Transcript_33025/m.98264 type:complete len:861 (+) Transcript_33025:138-2720(+)